MRRSNRGFTLIEVLVATVIMAVAVSALLGNLSTSTANLFRSDEIDRLNALSKRKMDELITAGNTLVPAGAVLEGGFEFDANRKPTSGFRATVMPASPLGMNTGERVDRIRLETWIQSGARRRTLVLEGFRTVKMQ